MLFRNDDCNDDDYSDNDDKLSNETPISTISIIRRRGKMSVVSRSTNTEQQRHQQLQVFL